MNTQKFRILVSAETYVRMVSLARDQAVSVSHLGSAAFRVLLFLLDELDTDIDSTMDFLSVLGLQDSIVDAPVLRILQDDERGFTMECEFQGPRVYNPATLQRLSRCLQELLEALVREPRRNLAAFEVLDAYSRHAMLALGQGPYTPAFTAVRIEDMFRQWVWQTPRRIALKDGDLQLDYAGLQANADELATHLRGAGLQPGSAVAVLLPRSAAAVVASLAILMAEGIYVPIDPSLPAQRITWMLQDCSIRFVICMPGIQFADTPCLWLDVDSYGKLKQVRGNRQNTLAQRPIETGKAAMDLAYVMYTSGTTGQPKGVPVTHRGVVRLVCGVDYVDLNEETEMLHAGAVGFDACTFEIWGALLNGGCLVVADHDSLLDTQAFEGLLTRHAVNTALLTPALFALHAERSPSLFSGLRQLVLGGDRFPQRQAEAVARVAPKLQFINAYGPTENAVISTANRVSMHDAPTVAIGHPIEQSTALVLNRHGRLLPIGFVGELYVGGDGLATGYINRPEQSALAFVPHPYLSGQKLYRTGDFVSWGQDRKLYFHGRRDHQVKIRGQRIELSEIEHTLVSHPAIASAIVQTVQTTAGETLLAAFVETTASLNRDELMFWLKQQLPAAMLPSHIEFVDSLPINQNGKIDRPALLARIQEQAPLTTGNIVHDSPRSVLMQAVAGLLELPAPDLSFSLIDLGGSSLTAVHLSHLIERRLQRRCSPGSILNARSLDALVTTLENFPIIREEVTPDVIEVEANALSHHQYRLYIEHIKDPESTAYHLPILITFHQEPDLARLHSALQKLVARHALLRAFFLRDGEKPRQYLADSIAIEIVTMDVRNDTLENLVEGLIEPFRLHEAPLWRCYLLKGPVSYLLFDIHHILCDGQALVALFRDWDLFYRGQEPAPVGMSYHECLALQKKSETPENWAALRAFWMKRLNPLPQEPSLPFDFDRKTVRSTQGQHFRFSVDAKRLAGMKDLTKRHGVTLFHGLLGAYVLWLMKTTGSRDVIVGVPALGRLITGSEDVFGMFVNTVCIRIRIETGYSTAEFLQMLRNNAIAAFEHQDYPFEALVHDLVKDRDYTRHPIFDSMFALQDTGLSAMQVLDGKLKWLPEATRSTLFDLNLQLEPEGNHLRAIWGYASDVFTQASIRAFADAWLGMIDMLIESKDATVETMLDNRKPATPLPDITFAF